MNVHQWNVSAKMRRRIFQLQAVHLQAIMSAALASRLRPDAYRTVRGCAGADVTGSAPGDRCDIICRMRKETGCPMWTVPLYCVTY